MSAPAGITPGGPPRYARAAAISPALRVIGTLLAITSLGAIVAGSHGRLVTNDRADGVLRVSWSARPERIEVCRRVSDEELARLAPHMRRRLICEGTTARYRLDVLRDGALLDSGTVRGGGLRHDRELYVARDIPVPAGAARISVRFVRLDSSVAADTVAAATRTPPTTGATSSGAGPMPIAPAVAPPAPGAPQGAPADRSAREAEERLRRRAEAVPALLALDTLVVLVPRTVLLVTYDAAARRLVMIQAP